MDEKTGIEKEIERRAAEIEEAFEGDEEGLREFLRSPIETTLPKKRREFITPNNKYFKSTNLSYGWRIVEETRDEIRWSE